MIRVDYSVGRVWLWTPDARFVLLPPGTGELGDVDLELLFVVAVVADLFHRAALDIIIRRFAGAP